MRPQLLVAGVLVVLTGTAFYVLQVPLVYFWSLPFAIVGLLMAAASPFVGAGAGPITPPEGSSFCVFCSTPVPLTSGRCPHCNGVQPRGGR